MVNGVKTNIPSFSVSVGDTILVKENKQKNAFWQNFNLEVPKTKVSWLDSSKKFEIKVINEPLAEDLPQNINIAKVVEYYSSKVA